MTETILFLLADIDPSSLLAFVSFGSGIGSSILDLTVFSVKSLTPVTSIGSPQADYMKEE